MQKAQISIRLSEQQLEQLDKLVEHYKYIQENEPQLNTFNARISKGSVLEMLVRDRYNEIFLKMG